MLSYPQGTYKNLRSDLEDTVGCRNKRHILKTTFFLHQNLIHCILPQNVNVSVILKGDFWMLHMKKTKQNENTFTEHLREKGNVS